MKDRINILLSAITIGVISGAGDANALGAADINKVAENFIMSISTLPHLISALGYLGGLFFGIMGVMKLRMHVENPGNAPLPSAAIRLFIGGIMLSLPTLYDVMTDTVGGGGINDAGGPNLVQVGFKE